MGIAKNIHLRLKEILQKLKAFNVIHSFSLKINIGRVYEDLQVCLDEVEALLQKYFGKIRLSRRATELRNVIGELLRRKNTEQSKFFEDDNCIMDYGDNECSAVRYSFCQDLELENSMEKEMSIHKKSYLCEFCGKITLNSSKFKVHSCEGHDNEDIETHEKGFLEEEMAQDGSLNLECEMDNECKTEVVKNTVDFTNDLENTTHSSNMTNSVNVSSTVPQNQNSTEDGVVSPTTETKSESFVCSYESCNKMYRIEQSLKKHMRLKHSSGIKSMFFCDKCEKSFPEKGKLNRHVLSHERGQFECPKCPRTFYRMDHLRRHLLLLHENVKRFECQFCKKKFSLGSNRDVHEKNVHMGEEIQCGSCGKMLKNETTYRQHKKIHDGNSFSCSFCSRRFLRKTEYRKHLMKKHKGMCPFQEFFNSFGEISFSDS